MLERALDLRRANANGAHALAHSMYEGGAGADADALIAGWLPDYDRCGILHGHIAWHAALVALERGDVDAALRTYAEQVQPAVSHGMPINVVSDAASLLWRIGAYGHSVPEGAWSKIATYAAASFPSAVHAFVDPHMAMIEAMMGDKQALERRVATLEGLAANGSLAAGMVVPAIARALLAFAEGDYALTVAFLEPLASDVARIGGSGAQREVVQDTLLIALMRSGEADKARRLLDQRLHRRPSPRDACWREQVATAVFPS